ncbi:MAG TPA: putative glycoside hydrolase [Erysipelotrichaceae bacterium]|nr:putative glycoside hydrolase [Erysipelotrichaceae bacterium]
MKKYLLINLIILSILFSACSKQEPETPIEEGPTQEEIDAQELALKIEERRVLEEQRKVDLGEFYVPLPSLEEPNDLVTAEAKALYVTSNVAGFEFNLDDIEYYKNYILALSGQSGQSVDESRLDQVNKLEKILGIAEATEINALVIDVKNDEGLVAWNSDIEIVNSVGSNWNTPLKNFDNLMTYLKEKEIYTIARIVAFKDPYFAKNNPDHAIQLSAGGVYKDKAGFAWVNPFDDYIWKYVVAVSQEAALRGFDEIQYDYVRFPDNAGHYNPITYFPGRNDRDKDEAIRDFLLFARESLKPYNVHVSADVFGVVTHSWDDKPEDIGQTWRLIANSTEYICPMIYPSHYGSGFYGFAVPDQYPYEIVRTALLEALERNAAQKEPAIIRSWYQGFTATWVKGNILYEEDAIGKQIAAGVELGLNEYIIWNASNTYYPLSFFYEDKVNKNVRIEGEDILERTPEEALKRYLDAQIFKRYSHQYLLTPINNRSEDYDIFSESIKSIEFVLKNYEVLSITKNEDNTFTANVNANYSSTQGKATLENASYTIVLEKDVYKIIQPELSWVSE